MSSLETKVNSHAGLSTREQVVATKFAEGMSYREIGEALFIAPTTVRTHLSVIYQKLGVHNKMALAAFLADRGTEEAVQTLPDGLFNKNSGPPIIAVLPFDNLVSDKRWTRLADGLSADFIVDLARAP